MLSPQSLLQGLGALVDNPAVAEFAGHAGNKAVSVLQAHFTFTAQEITKAYQQSLEKTLAAISNALAQKSSSRLSSKLQRDFSAQFAAQIVSSGMPSDALSSFVKHKT